METSKIIKIEDTWNKPNEGLAIVPHKLYFLSVDDSFVNVDWGKEKTEDAEFEIIEPLQLTERLAIAGALIAAELDRLNSVDAAQVSDTTGVQ